MNAVLQVETPKEAARRLSAHKLREGYKAEALHVYANASGDPVYWRIRCKHPDTGAKWIRPMHWNGIAFVNGEPPLLEEGKPLYQVPELLAADPASLVLIVEGEWCADHLHRRGLIVITSGSCSSASGADWTPLRGRHCLLWPDNDAPGSKYADEAAAILQSLGCAVELIDVEPLGLPDKGDAADWLALHPDAKAADVLALARSEVDANRPAASMVDAMPRVILTRGSDVQPEAVDWLWDGWLAAGKLHLIGGAPGTGKTTLAASLAAIITCGGRWPDGKRAETGSVVFWSGEDDNSDTLNPRLRAAGADMTRVFTVDGVREGGERYPFDPACDVEALRAALAGISGVRLIVIDPIVSAVAKDSHNNGDVRRGLQPLVDLGMQLGAAVLGVTHFSKGTSGRDPVERITGSLAFAALARLVMVTAKQEADGERPERRVILRAKSNSGPDGGGFVYDLQQGELSGFPGVSASSVLWGESIHGTARELLAEAEQRDDDHDAAGDAVDFLHSVLAFGSRFVKEIKAEAASAGIAWRTLERAKRKAGVEARKSGMNAGWEWYKLPKTAKKDEDRQPERVAAFGGLRENVAVFGEERTGEREDFTV